MLKAMFSREEDNLQSEGPEELDRLSYFYMPYFATAGVFVTTVFVPMVYYARNANLRRVVWIHVKDVSMMYSI